MNRQRKLKRGYGLALAALTTAFAPAVRAEKYSTADYVQNGLVAMWDCSSIELEEGQLYATSWVDSIGGKTMSFSISAGLTPKPTGVYFPGATSDYGYLSTTDTKDVFLVSSKDSTLEVVFKRDQSSSDDMVVVHAPRKTNGWGQFLYVGTDFFLANSKVAGPKISCSGLDEICTIASRYSDENSGYGGVANEPGFLNGVPCAYGAAKSLNWENTTQAYIGRRQGTASNPFKGTIYAIRVYNRRLNDHEIETNAKVDAARFKNGDADKPSFNDETKEYGYTRTYTRDGTSYVVEAFTNSNDKTTWTVPTGVNSIELLVIAGGGSGGATASNYAPAGGGAGGLIHETSVSVASGTQYAVTVGAGGASVSGTSDGNKGGDSKFGLDGSEYYVAEGGGYGKGKDKGVGGEGGSSGGSLNSASVAKATQSEKTCGGFGNVGASGTGWYVGSGGGGAGAAGGRPYSSTTGYVGPGGAGKSIDMTGESWIYAYGGQSGYGYGSSSHLRIGLDGADGYGAGGSGSKYAASGKGGDGVVIVRYVKPCIVTWNDSQKMTVTATYGDPATAVSNGDGVPPNTVVTVSAVRTVGSFASEVTSQGWAFDADGNISQSFTITTDTAIQIPEPQGGTSYTVTFTVATHATYAAFLGDTPVSSGSQVAQDADIDTVATPVAHYRYESIPDGWVAFEDGAISNRTAMTEDKMIVIPEASAIMIPVAVALPEGFADQGTCVITAGGETIASGTSVLEGTEIVITVTPGDAYEYAVVPEGWTKDDEGKITYETTAQIGMGTISVTSPTMKLVTLAVTSYGVSYTMTNVTTEAELKNGDKVDGDVLVKVCATAFQTYVLPTEPGTGWEIVEGVLTGTFLAGAMNGAITIPSAVWTPTNGELIENGGFEYFDPSQLPADWYAFPASLAGTWRGDLVTYSQGEGHFYSLYGTNTAWKTKPVPACRGNYSCAARGYVGKPYLYVTFTTPANATTQSTYKLKFCAAKERTGDATQFGVKLQNAGGTQTIRTLKEATNDLTTEWRQFEIEFTGLQRNTTYRLRFDGGSSIGSGFCLDDVSLKWVKSFMFIIK